MTKPEPMLWLDDHRGVYIPHDFALSFANRERDVSGVDNEEWATLENGPDEDFYWDVWADVCDHAVVTDEHGVQYHVYQDGACWLIPLGMEWDEKNDFFQWPKKAEEDE